MGIYQVLVVFLMLFTTIESQEVPKEIQGVLGQFQNEIGNRDALVSQMKGRPGVLPRDEIVLGVLRKGKAISQEELFSILKTIEPLSMVAQYGDIALQAHKSYSSTMSKFIPDQEVVNFLKGRDETFIAKYQAICEMTLTWWDCWTDVRSENRTAPSWHHPLAPQIPTSDTNGIIPLQWRKEFQNHVQTLTMEDRKKFIARITKKKINDDDDEFDLMDSVTIFCLPQQIQEIIWKANAIYPRLTFRKLGLSQEQKTPTIIPDPIKDKKTTQWLNTVRDPNLVTSSATIAQLFFAVGQLEKWRNDNKNPNDSQMDIVMEEVKIIFDRIRQLEQAKWNNRREDDAKIPKGLPDDLSKILEMELITIDKRTYLIDCEKHPDGVERIQKVISELTSWISSHPDSELIPVAKQELARMYRQLMRGSTFDAMLKTSNKILEELQDLPEYYPLQLQNSPRQHLARLRWTKEEMIRKYSKIRPLLYHIESATTPTEEIQRNGHRARLNKATLRYYPQYELDTLIEREKEDFEEKRRAVAESLMWHCEGQIETMLQVVREFREFTYLYHPARHAAAKRLVGKFGSVEVAP